MGAAAPRLHERAGAGTSGREPLPDARVERVAVDYKTIGVVPAHRRGYLGWALLHRAYTSALELGRPVANHCLMHESNASQSMDAGHGTTFREYYLYTL